MILVLDTETGGLGLDKSLLQIAMVVVDWRDYSILDKLNLKVKPDAKRGERSVYVVEAEGLAVNKINLVEHNKDAMQYSEAAGLIYDFLNKNSQQGKDKLILTGKNVHGDVYQIWDKIMKRSTWETFVSYQWMDFSAIWNFLVIEGTVQLLESASLKSICEFLKINTEGIHDAEKDCMMVIECFKAIDNGGYFR